jgi:hypothetical protein
MISPLYEWDGLDFRPQDGKTSERQFAIIAFVIGCAAPGLKSPNDAPLERHSKPALLFPGKLSHVQD